MYNLFWGDLHKHLEDFDRVDEIIELAKYNLDFYCVLCYPFKWLDFKGARVETVRQHPEFLQRWERLRAAARSHNVEGRFVTFLGYEWHGNRTRFGDHNVIYFDEDNPLDDAWQLEELYANLRRRRAYAIPHHTGYYEGHRGKSWDLWDPSISPVMEIFSSHGSSEGIDTPFDMLNNRSMGPRTSGGTLIDALNRGHRIGVIASNDGSGLPGSWPSGIAGVWAEKLTREGIWEAIGKRRTIGTTGDRISLWFSINDIPLGSVLRGNGSLDAKVSLRCPQPLDRVELVHNGKVHRTYCHRGRWKNSGKGRYRILFEFGLGPSTQYGYAEVKQRWAGELGVNGGILRSVHPRFVGLGQRYRMMGENICEFELTMSRNGEVGFRQGLVLEVEGDKHSILNINVDDHEFDVELGDCFSNVHLFPLLEESIERARHVFNIDREELENPDIYYHNARKIRIHPAYPLEACDVDIDFKRLARGRGNNYYYVRASQIDGQMAWSSPIWVEVPT